MCGPKAADTESLSADRSQQNLLLLLGELFVLMHRIVDFSNGAGPTQ